MKFITVPLKNIFGNLGRSITFGSFIFVGTVIAIFGTSFVNTIESNMENLIINALTGHIQIRSSASEEKDMYSYTPSWGNVDYLGYSETKVIEDILEQNGCSDYFRRVRHNAMFISNKTKEPVKIIGIDLRSKKYQESFKITHGRYLDPDNTHEVILPNELAEALKVKTGDALAVVAQTKDGYMVDSVLTVVGIGQSTLAAYSFIFAYVDLKSAQELYGYEQEVSDIIVYLDDKHKADKTIEKLNPFFQKAGLSEYVKLSTWEGMGGYLMGMISVYKGVFISFFLFMMFIISILIINLVYMMGLERRREIGTFRGIGFSRLKTVMLFISEILIVTVLFNFLGILAGTGLVLTLGQVGIPVDPRMTFSFDEQLFIKFDFLQTVFVIAVIYGFTFLASLYASFKATALRPAETLAAA